jgi:hypothetical protein
MVNSRVTSLPRLHSHKVGKEGGGLGQQTFGAAGQLGLVIAHRVDVFAAAIDDDAHGLFLAMQGIGGDHRAVQRGLNLRQQLPARQAFRSHPWL